MFTFHRTESRPAEIWNIIVAEGSLQDAESRFGSALRFNAREPDEGQGPNSFHKIGVLVAFEVKNGDVEFLLACKDGLTDAEKSILQVELEMVLGREVYRHGTEETCGWFLHDALASG